MQPSDFELLLDRYQSGESSPEEVRELEASLRADPEKRRRFVERSLLEVQLHKVFSARLSTRKLWRTGVSAAAAAAVLLLGAFLLYAYVWRTGQGPELVAGEVRIGGATARRIPEDVWFEVGDGAAVIRLSGGSRVELDPSSKASIQSHVGKTRHFVEFSQGGGTFQVASGSGEFRVETPAGSVTALGTEFSVKLQPRRNTKAGTKRKLAMAVAVTEGSVRVEVSGKSGVVLSAGKSRVFGDDGDQNNRDDGEQNNRDDGQKQN